MPIPAGEEPGRCEWKSGSGPLLAQAEVFFVGKTESEGVSSDGTHHAHLPGVRPDLPARGALRLRALLRTAGGRLRPRRPRRRRGEAQDPGRPGGHLALRRLPPARRPSARSAAAGPDPAGARRPARGPARDRRALDQERRRQPDPLVQGPRGRGGAGEGARARLRDRGLRLDRQPRQRRRGPRRGGRARVLRLRARRPRGAEAARNRGLRHPPGRRARQLRRRQPPLHRALRDGGPGPS